ncbi:MAG: TatD family hydrolase [Burkholderiales bacterium]|jgi:TatD DNase family protein|nr:TatD family hydrolase [Zoogloeaceae bacterium]MBP9654047.1 TatD family hydrolase [Rhodocyclaceae bacterium]MCZ2174390.1 TatD family hydrolase [Burkholderiales bacterium]HNQ57815.1 TatD family hydrolase [Candidatus Desulfobacillus denitrificans]MBV6410763.1 putative metal-dependent hydrolase YcfH [Rhodocyclaceae bacterium]
MLVDSHCHLDFPELADRIDQVIDSMMHANVGAALCIGVSLEQMPKVQALAEKHRNLYATVGVHPEHQDCLEPDVETLLRFADHPKVLGIGETGLDYFWHKDKPEWQRERFRVHIRAAKACGKPLIIHTRDSAADILQILRVEGADSVGGVMHCFTETREVAEKALDMGFYISFSGIVTFKNAHELKETAKMVPMDRLLVETDSPFLAPVPHRGKTNEPAYVRHVANEIAALKGIGIDEVESQTTENFCKLFKVIIN